MGQLEVLRSKSLQQGSLKDYIEFIKSDLKFNAEFISNSAGIEGNTITEAETMTLLKVASTQELSEKHSAEEVREIKDLYNAVEVMLELTEYSELEEEIIKALHVATVASDASIVGGAYKMFDNYTFHNGKKKDYVAAEDVSDAIYDLCEEYNNSDRSLEDISLMLLKFINIHPFTDGNGRVHRLLINWALVTNNYIPVIVKIDDKKRYINALHEYGESESIDDFYQLLEDKLIEGYQHILNPDITEPVITKKTSRF